MCQEFSEHLLLLKKKIIYLLLSRGEGREKKRERNINVWVPLRGPLLGTWPATQACALTGNPTGTLLVHRLVLNPLSYISQGIMRTFLLNSYTNPHFTEEETETTELMALGEVT